VRQRFGATEQLAGTGKAPFDGRILSIFSVLRRLGNVCEEALESLCPGPSLHDRQQLLTAVLQRLRTSAFFFLPLPLALLCFPLALALLGLALCLPR
jgi:hypothetical protein